MHKIYKFLFVIDNLNIGGPQKSLLALLDNINYDLFDVTVLSLKPNGKLKQFYNHNVKIIEADDLLQASMMPSNKPLWALFIFFKHFKFNCLFSAIISIFKRAILKTSMNRERQHFWVKYHKENNKINGKYDFACGILGLSTYFVVDLVDSKLKYHWIRSDPRFLKLDENIESMYFKQIDGALSVSRICAEIFKKMYPFLSDRIHVFYNYIPLSFYSKIKIDQQLLNAKDNELKIISISRLVPNKGIEWILRVAQELKSRKINYKWYILGDGELKNSYIIEAKKQQISDNLKFVGFQLNTLPFLEYADIFVHLSESEGKSNAVDEAKFLCKPIVITNYPTVTEQIIDKKTGLICNFDVNEISDRILLLTQSNVANELANNLKNEKENQINANDFLLKILLLH